MPLSPKIIFKQPSVAGECSYGSGRSGAERGALPEDNPEMIPPGAVPFWPQAGGEKEKAAGAGNPGQAGPPGEQSLEPVAGKGPGVAGGYEEQLVEEMVADRLRRTRQESYEQGKAEAEKECRAMRKEAAARLQEAEKSLTEARRRSREIVAAAEEKIVELAMAVAEKLVRTQIEIAPDTVQSILRETMNSLGGGEQVEVYVNPDDLQSCSAFGSRLKEEFRTVSKLDFLADPAVPRGSCRIESESGVAEYLIEEEREQLRSTLQEIARREGQRVSEGEGSGHEKH